MSFLYKIIFKFYFEKHIPYCRRNKSQNRERNRKSIPNCFLKQKVSYHPIFNKRKFPIRKKSAQKKSKHFSFKKRIVKQTNSSINFKIITMEKWNSKAKQDVQSCENL